MEPYECNLCHSETSALVSHPGVSPFLSPGQHDCVTVINNFFSRAKLEYYTIRQGLEKEPKLPPKLAGPLHKIIMSTNLNPVKVKYHHRCLWATLWNSGFGVKY